MTKPIIFLGCNSNLLQYVIVCELNNIPVAGIIDSDYFGNTENYKGIPIIDSELTADFKKLSQQYDFFIGTNPVSKRNIHRRNNFIKLVNEYNLPCANIIDPSARITRGSSIGKGTYISFCVSIGTDAIIGDHCQIHTHAIVGDNCVLKDNIIVQRNCMLTGYINVDSNAYLGINTTLIKRDKFPNLNVGANSKTWPSLTIMRDIKEDEVVTPKTAHRIYR